MIRLYLETITLAVVRSKTRHGLPRTLKEDSACTKRCSVFGNHMAFGYFKFCRDQKLFPRGVKTRIFSILISKIEVMEMGRVYLPGLWI